MSAVGIAFKYSRRGKLVHAILECLNKLLSHAKGAPNLMLKALSERRGNRAQTFLAREILAHDVIISK